jgi:lysozyme
MRNSPSIQNNRESFIKLIDTTIQVWYTYAILAIITGRIMPFNFLEKLGKTLKPDEGLQLYPYKDIFGNLTIGYGRNLSSKGISRDEADYLFQQDIQECLKDLQTLTFWNDLNDDRKIVLVCMCFNLGWPRFMGFRNMLSALEKKDYELASKEILDSEAAKQLKSRYERLAYFMETGKI